MFYIIYLKRGIIMRIKFFGINFYLKRETAIIVVALTTLAVFVAVFTVTNNKNRIVFKTDGNSIELNQETIESTEEISVYIIGYIGNPGIYKLSKGQILNDLITDAGGFTKDADRGNINLAYRIEDNIMIKILGKEDMQNGEEGDSPAGNGIIITRGLTEDLENNLQNGLININTANSDRLKLLPGIGETRAEKIISYRKVNGGFAEKEDIMKVDGIKEGIYSNIEDLIAVE